jgi:Ni/Fe-hydrogenase subunit HybB-like protein
LIGFICYSSALLILAIDIGQPLRRWFIFWHANVHSMLTEVAFCLSCYFAVLTIEYIPLILENRQLDKVPFFHNLSHNMHEYMAVFAATGAFFLSFHQGSLGGVAGVLFGRPFAYREHFIWPWTFFLFTWSAAAYGPALPCSSPGSLKNYQEKTGQRQRHLVAGKDLRLDDHSPISSPKSSIRYTG